MGAVSYTHLDVYKRQVFDDAGIDSAHHTVQIEYLQKKSKIIIFKTVICANYILYDTEIH